ncbi:hypothetical protein ACKVWC_011560 [Pyricularia oryzae]
MYMLKVVVCTSILLLVEVVALVDDGDLDPIQVMRPVLGDETLELEQKVRLDADSLLAGGLAGDRLQDAADGLGGGGSTNAQLLVPIEGETVVHARLGRQSRGEIHQSTEDLDGQLNRHRGVDVSADLGLLGDVGGRGVLGIPAGSGGPPVLVDQVKVDVSVGHGYTERRVDIDGSRCGKIDTDPKGDAGAERDDARDGDQRVLQLVCRVLKVLRVGGLDASRQCDVGLEAGVEIKVELLELERPKVVVELPREGDGRLEGGVVSSDLEVWLEVQQGLLIGKGGAERERCAGVEVDALAEGGGGQRREGHLAGLGDLLDLLGRCRAGDGQVILVGLDILDLEETTLELVVAVALAVGDNDQAVLERLPVLGGDIKGLRVGEIDRQEVLGALDIGDGVNVLEGNKGVVGGQGHVDRPLRRRHRGVVAGGAVGKGGRGGRAAVIAVKEGDMGRRDDVLLVRGVDVGRLARLEGRGGVDGSVDAAANNLFGQLLHGGVLVGHVDDNVAHHLFLRWALTLLLAADGTSKGGRGEEG